MTPADRHRNMGSRRRKSSRSVRPVLLELVIEGTNTSASAPLKLNRNNLRWEGEKREGSLLAE